MNLLQMRIQKIKNEMTRGQGGETVYSYPIGIEPSFEPFQHAVSQPSIFDRLFQGAQRTSLNHRIQQVEQRPFTAIHMRPSIEDKGGMQTAVHILTALHLRHPASFEVIGNQRFIATQLAIDPEDAASIIGVISSHYPHAEVFAGEDIVRKTLEGPNLVVKTYCLQESHFFPLNIDVRSADPYQTIFGILSGLGKSEIGTFQVLFIPTQHDWKSNILKASQSEYDPSKSPFFDLPDLIKIAEKKTAYPLFCCSIRLAGSSLHVIHRLEGFFYQFTGDNRLISTQGNYPPSSVMNRTNHTTGVIFNAVELSALIHLPSPEAIMPPLIQARRTAPPPELARDPQGILLGENSHKGQSRPVAVSKDWLTRHVLVLGATGSGKTIWQTNFFQQFIQHHGSIYIDPSGDSAKAFLKLIPPHRIKDAIYLDPSDPEHAPAFNVLEQSTGDYDLTKGLILIAFKRLFAPEGIGPRSEFLLSHAISTILKSAHRPKTLLDIPRIFTDKNFRSNVLASIGDVEISNFWKTEYSKLPESAILPLLNKLHAFLGHEKIRSMLCQSGKIDLTQIIHKKKIFIINLAKGLLGESAAVTTGFLFLSAIQQAVMGLAKIPPPERDYFALILDEAHLFLTRENTDTMNSLLSESRKLKWVNVIGTQFLAQADTKVRDALMGNVGSIISFKVGTDDARILQKEFGSFMADDLLNLMPGEAIMRAGRAQDSFNMKTHFIDLEALPSGYSQEIIKRSRELYYTPRQELARVHHVSEIVSANSDCRNNVQTREIAPLEKSFLECVLTHPTLSITKIYMTLKLSGYMGDRSKKALSDRGFLKEVSTHLGKGSRITKFLYLTTEGFKTLGISYGSDNGKGGTLHRYWQEFIKHQAEAKGFNATIEEAIPGTNETVDLGLHKDGKRIAVEISITTPAEHEVNNNIKKCLKTGYHKIIVLALDESKMAEIQEHIKTVLSQDEQSVVTSGLVYDFYRFV